MVEGRVKVSGRKHHRVLVVSNFQPSLQLSRPKRGCDGNSTARNNDIEFRWTAVDQIRHAVECILDAFYPAFLGLQNANRLASFLGQKGPYMQCFGASQDTIPRAPQFAEGARWFNWSSTAPSVLPGRFQNILCIWIYDICSMYTYIYIHTCCPTFASKPMILDWFGAWEELFVNLKLCGTVLNSLLAM